MKKRGEACDLRELLSKPNGYNQLMRSFKVICLLIGIGALCALSVGCAATAPASTQTPRPTPTIPIGTLRPFVPSPPASVPTPTATPTPARLPAAVPSPTATPLTHVVKANEDMGGIALRYHVNLSDLIAANPTVNPRAMSVGTVLVIPASAQAAPTSDNPTPTALPVSMQPPDCWPVGDGGLWCFLLAQNPLDSPIENIFVRFRLAGPSGPQLLEREASGLLNLLPPGQRLPVSIYFSGPLPEKPRVSAELIAAYPLPPDDIRYLTATLSAVQMTISPDGQSAQLSGQIGASDSAQTAWVAAAALDETGHVVGLRRWQNSQPLTVGSSQNFSLSIYSLGGKIARIEYLSEIRR